MEAQEFFQTTFCQQLPPSPDNTSTTTANVNIVASDNFIVEDLFDFSNDDVVINDSTFDNSPPPPNFDDSPPPPPKTNTNINIFTNNLGHNSVGGLFPASSELVLGELICVPPEYDELAELEWLSKFAEEESFSSEDLDKLELISGMKTSNDESNPQVYVTAKARSKRSRGPPCNWTSRLEVITPTTIESPKKSSPRKRDTADGEDGRRCLHCATDKTPQWRTGPMGPKTLCNACGVRYKSGRLVPEYRPASSPTFVLTKHSNSHRKVQELRRQKEEMMTHHHQLLQLQRYHHQNIMFDGP